MPTTIPGSFSAPLLLSLLLTVLSLHGILCVEVTGMPLNVSGFLDVTAAPYLADNSGRTDCTKALQTAVDDARAQFLAVYLPHGTYLISDTITLLQVDAWDPGQSNPMNNTWPCRFQPNVVVGARSFVSGGAAVRPVIRLAPNSPKFQDANAPMPMLDFTRHLNGHVPVVDGTNFNQLLRGVDLHLDGNAGATGVMLPGAQGCSVQDVTITVGNGYSGITGGSGAGGGHSMVTVIGGRFGLDYTVSLNAPGSTGMTLLNQSVSAILYDGLEAASFVGAVIRPLPGAAVVLSKTQSYWGQVSVVDSIIEYPESSASCVAFDTIHSLYLSNVYVFNCASFARGVSANPNGWALAHEVAVGADIPTPSRSCKVATMPAYVNGVALTAALVNTSVSGVAPPSVTVVQQHKWDESSYPTFDMEGVYNAKQFGAKGDGNSDDADAIQAAVDAATATGGTVFLPKGFYRISRTINMTARALIGAARSLSVLMPMSDGLTGMSVSPAPVLHFPPPSPGSPRLQQFMSMMSIVTWEHLNTVWALWWQNGHPDSSYRQCYMYRITECFYGFPHPQPVPVPASSPTIPCRPQADLAHPLNIIGDGAAGHFYNFENEDFLYEAPLYRHLLVQDTVGPLRFYNMNFEHASSEANAEFRNASNIFVYSLKSEGEWRDLIYHGALNNPGVVLWVRNCSEVNVYSFGGNARAMATGRSYPEGFSQYAPSLYRFERTCPLRVTNCVDQFQFEPDNDWNFVYEEWQGNTTLSQHCERPVLFARTEC